VGLTPVLGLLGNTDLLPLTVHSFLFPAVPRWANPLKSRQKYSERQCVRTSWFPGLAISSAKMSIYFSSEMYGSNSVKQHSELLWFEITDMLTAVVKGKFIMCLL